MTTFLTHKKEDKEAFLKTMNKVAAALAESFADDKAYSGYTPQELQKLIRQENILPEKGFGFEKVFETTKEKILPHLLKTSSPDYMPHLHSPALLETIAAELIISTFNQSMDSWDQSPVATEIEIEVINRLCALYGYSQNADGVFTSGGSQSNQTAIILARDAFCANILNYDVKKYGVDERCRKLRMYASEISHFSMEKSAHVLGLGYQAVVKVPVDSNKKMDVNALSLLVQKDLERGNIPFLIVATIGTTDFGSIDDARELFKIARKNKMRLHADAAYGSGVVLSKKYSERVNFLNLCDSITVDFHKMFLTPISCSAVLVKNGKDFDALTIRADYLNRAEDEEDGYVNLVDKSLQTTRRFDALKVWISFQTRGKDGWARLIDACMDNAVYLWEILKNDSDFEVIAKPEISSVVFRYAASENADEINKKVRRILLHEKGVVVGQTVSDSKVCLKFTLLNPLVTRKKLKDLVNAIKTISKNLADNPAFYKQTRAF